MSQPQPTIRHISDTARWAAVYRAQETERPDALFRDHFAKRLAGERGAQIAASLPFHDQNSWSWVTRTYLFDQFITQHLEQQPPIDLVVNLAAGLDARPYRMPLSPSLNWIEVDLPEILDYKETILGSEKPNCALERVRLDLSDVPARRALFERLDRKATRALVITEGLIIYLAPDEAGALAEDLARPRIFQRWALDLASPGLLRMLQKKTHAQFSEGVAPLRFAPENGPSFFASHGWNPSDVRSILRTAAHLKRVSWGMRLLSHLPENPARMGSRPWSGVCLLARS